MLKRLIALSPLVLIAAPAAAHAAQPHFAEGQVWQYTTRAQDKGSLVKIQKIEIEDGRPVYHVSVIGVHFGNVGETSTLPHLPVSEATLDASVTRQEPAGARAFANLSIDGDIAEWHAEHGGVLSVPLAQALNDVDVMLSSAPAPASPFAAS